MKHFEIWWVDLDPTVGHETQKKRPCLLVQSDLVSRGSKTLLIAPILPGHKDWPFVVNLIPSAENGLDQERHVNLKQLRAVDTSRVKNRNGILEKSYLKAVQQCLRIVLSIP